MGVSAATRDALATAVASRGAEQVGREVGVSGEQIRQLLGGATKSVRSATASRYERWALRQAAGWQPWEPALALAATAEAIAGLLERTLEQQRALALDLRDLSPGVQADRVGAAAGLALAATPREPAALPASARKGRRPREG